MADSSFYKQSVDVYDTLSATYLLRTSNSNLPDARVVTDNPIAGGIVADWSVSAQVKFKGYVSGANKFLYSTGENTWAEGAITSFARTVLDDADAATARSTLGAASNAEDYLVKTASSDLSAERVVTDSNAAGGVVADWSVAGQVKFKGYASGANKMLYSTGANAWAEQSITAAGRALINSTVTANASGDVTGVRELTVVGNGVSLASSFPTHYYRIVPSEYQTYLQIGYWTGVWSSGVPHLALTGDGKIGVRNLSPVCTFDVNGVIRASNYMRADLLKNASDGATVIYRDGAATRVGNAASPLIAKDTGHVSVGTTFSVGRDDLQPGQACSVKITTDCNMSVQNAWNGSVFYPLISSHNDVFSEWRPLSVNNLVYLDSSTGFVGVGDGNTTPTAVLHNINSTRLAHLGAGTVQSDASGNITVSSDERLKSIDGDFTKSIAALRGIVPILYHWNESSKLDQLNQYAGFSAQNVQANIPEAVSLDGDGFLALNDRALLAAVINAVKNIDARLTAAGF